MENGFTVKMDPKSYISILTVGNKEIGDRSLKMRVLLLIKASLE